jgi:hypothetical protein
MPINTLRRKSKKPPLKGRLTTPLSADDGPKSILRTLGPLILLIGAVSLANVASQLALYPLYGATVVSMHFETMSLAICMLASFIPFPASMEGMAWTALTVIIPASPALLYAVGTRTAWWNDPVWGPTTTQIVSSIPNQFLANLVIISRIVSPSEYSFLEKLTRGVSSIGPSPEWNLPLFLRQACAWICYLVCVCEGGPSVVGLFVHAGRIQLQPSEHSTRLRVMYRTFNTKHSMYLSPLARLCPPQCFLFQMKPASSRVRHQHPPCYEQPLLGGPLFTLPSLSSSQSLLKIIPPALRLHSHTLPLIILSVCLTVNTVQLV